MTPISFLITGDDDFTIGCGDALRARGHVIAGVASRSGAVRAWAGAAGLPVADRIGALAAGGEAEWLLLASGPPVPPVPAVPPEAARAAVRRGTLRFHDGPQPDCGAAAPPAGALLAGATRHGVVWHIPGGPVLVQQSVAIGPEETAASLIGKCRAAGLESFDALLCKLAAGDLNAATQDIDCQYKSKPEIVPQAAGRLDFTWPAPELARRVRGLDFGGLWNPLTTAKVRAGGRLLLVSGAHLVETVAPVAPGTVLHVTQESLTVATSDGAVRLCGFRDTSGQQVALYPAALEGAELASPGEAEAKALSAERAALARDEPHWRARLARFRPARLALAGPGPGGGAGGGPGAGLASWNDRQLALPKTFAAPEAAPELVAALTAWGLHSTGDWRAGLAWSTAPMVAGAKAHPGHVSPWVPLGFGLEAPEEATIAALAADLAPDLAAAARGSFAPDLVARDPEITAFGMASVGISDRAPVAGTALTLTPEGDRLRLWYDAQRLDEAALDLLEARLALFLDNLAANPALPLRALLALPAAERALTLVAWNGPQPADPPVPVHQAFEAQADRAPERVALVSGGRQMSYGALDARANRLAHRLIAEGARPGDRVGMYLTRSFDLAVAALAVLKAGAAWLPLDPAWPAGRLRQHISDAGAALVVTDLALAPILPPSAAVPVMIGGGADARRPGLDVAGEAVALVTRAADASGGVPGPVMLTHRALSAFCAGIGALADPGATCPGTTWAWLAGPGSGASALEMFCALTRGGQVVVVSEDARLALSGAQGASLADDLTRHRVTVLHGSPAMLQRILDDPGARAALRGLKQILLGGEPVSAALAGELRRFTDARIVRLFRPCGSALYTMAHVIEGGESGAGPLGRPLAGQSVYVLDKAMQPVPVGVAGDLWIGGPGVPGRHGDDDGRIRRDPFAAGPGHAGEQAQMFCTGERVRWRADGLLERLGPRRRRLTICGETLAPGEIEARIARAGGGSRAAVAVKGERPRLVAWVEAVGAAGLAAIRADLVAHLPAPMLPAQVIALEALPRGETGGIDRAALPEPGAELRIGGPGDAPLPAAGLEAEIAAIWSGVLGVSDIRRADSFFALGGDLCGAAAVLARIRALDGLAGTAPHALFRFPLLGDLAGHLAQQRLPPADRAGVPEFDRQAIMARRRDMRRRSERVAP